MLQPGNVMKSCRRLQPLGNTRGCADGSHCASSPPALPLKPHARPHTQALRTFRCCRCPNPCLLVLPPGGAPATRAAAPTKTALAPPQPLPPVMSRPLPLPPPPPHCPSPPPPVHLHRRGPGTAHTQSISPKDQTSLLSIQTSGLSRSRMHSGAVLRGFGRPFVNLQRGPWV